MTQIYQLQSTEDKPAFQQIKQPCEPCDVTLHTTTCTFTLIQGRVQLQHVQ